MALFSVALQENVSLWDMYIFLLPLAATLFIAGYNAFAKRRDEHNEKDRQHQETLAKYYDSMTELLTKHKLKEEENKTIRTLAKARTLSAVRDLDRVRRGRVLKFLSDNELINKKRIIILECADFNDAELRDAHLEGAHLEGVYLNRAELYNVHLEGAHLQGAKLEEANLEEANLSECKVTLKQLYQTKSFKNATMPNGMKYEDWVAKGKPDWTKEE